MRTLNLPELVGTKEHAIQALRNNRVDSDMTGETLIIFCRDNRYVSKTFIKELFMQAFETYNALNIELVGASEKTFQEFQFVAKSMNKSSKLKIKKV